MITPLNGQVQLRKPASLGCELLGPKVPASSDRRLTTALGSFQRRGMHVKGPRRFVRGSEESRVMMTYPSLFCLVGFINTKRMSGTRLEILEEH